MDLSPCYLLLFRCLCLLVRACTCVHVFVRMCACVCVCASALKILSNKITNQLFPLNMDECKEKREKRKKGERERESYDLVGKIKHHANQNKCNQFTTKSFN